MRSPSTTLLCQYRYDALDQLIVSTLPNEPPHQRFYCKSRLATKIHGAVHYSIVQHDDQLLARQQSENGAINTALLATDRQRSVLCTLDGTQPLQRVAYSPYGYRPPLNALNNLPGFNGEHPDPVTGCYLLGNGYRAFNSVLMRFSGSDSLSPFEKGGLSSYAYCQADPTNSIDPSGRFPVRLLQAVKKISPSKNLSITMHSFPVDEVLAATRHAMTNTPAGELAKTFPANFQYKPTRPSDIKAYADAGLDLLRIPRQNERAPGTVATVNSAAAHSLYSQHALQQQMPEISRVAQRLEEAVSRLQGAISRSGANGRSPSRQAFGRERSEVANGIRQPQPGNIRKVSDLRRREQFEAYTRLINQGYRRR